MDTNIADLRKSDWVDVEAKLRGLAEERGPHAEQTFLHLFVGDLPQTWDEKAVLRMFTELAGNRAPSLLIATIQDVKEKYCDSIAHRHEVTAHLYRIAKYLANINAPECARIALWCLKDDPKTRPWYVRRCQPILHKATFELGEELSTEDLQLIAELGPMPSISDQGGDIVHETVGVDDIRSHAHALLTLRSKQDVKPTAGQSPAPDAGRAKKWYKF